MPKSSKIKKANLIKVHRNALELNKKQNGINVGRVGLGTFGNRRKPYTIKVTPVGAVLEYTTRFGKKLQIELSRENVVESARKAFQTVVIDKTPYQANKAASRRRNSTTSHRDI